MMAEPYWMYSEAAWRPFKPCHLYFIPSLEQCGLVDMVAFSQMLDSMILEVISNPKILWFYDSMNIGIH